MKVFRFLTVPTVFHDNLNIRDKKTKEIAKKLDKIFTYFRNKYAVIFLIYIEFTWNRFFFAVLNKCNI